MNLRPIYNACTPDMGVYEFGAVPCLSDANLDGTVNVLDLLMVINNWGTCGGSPCEGDMWSLSCGDGYVDVQDLLLVINHWNCGYEEPTAMPESVSDCYNEVCDGLTGEDWERCMDDA